MSGSEMRIVAQALARSVDWQSTALLIAPWSEVLLARGAVSRC